jgi:hypothetical protein
MFFYRIFLFYFQTSSVARRVPVDGAGDQLGEPLLALPAPVEHHVGVAVCKFVNKLCYKKLSDVKAEHEFINKKY